MLTPNVHLIGEVDRRRKRYSKNGMSFTSVLQLRNRVSLELPIKDDLNVGRQHTRRVTMATSERANDSVFWLAFSESTE